MSEENKTELAVVKETPEDIEHTVSLTFRDEKTGRNVLKIISVCTPEDKERLGADQTGELLTKFVIAKALHQFHLKVVPEDPQTNA